MQLLQLPEESLERISGFLPAPDILRLLSTHHGLYKLGLSPQYWESLKKNQYESPTGVVDDAMVMEDASLRWKEAKDAYLLKAYTHYLPAVRWYPVAERFHVTPTAREGHLCCRLGKSIVLTGGFAEDPAAHIKNIDTDEDDWQAIPVSTIGTTRVPWVYGATLTALDDRRAVRFGGFQAGGYSAETAAVALFQLDYDDSDTSSSSNNNNRTLRASWKLQPCRFSDGREIPENHRGWASFAARAYHSATLLLGRYLVIIGGMKSTGSCLNPMVLDTQTWTFYDHNITIGLDDTGSIPSDRHGHSVIYDEKRQRLVLFGGGSGSDLLRSGQDNTEVWELDLNGWAAAADDEPSFSSAPWIWRKVHADQPNSSADDDEDDGANMREGDNTDPNRLSPAEKLNFGRCHGGYRISPDKALLVFGSGRPSTNSILGYDLAKDQFLRPPVQGPLPTARFTFASVFLEDLGYLVFHGGFSVQISGAITNTCVLDLAPGLKRDFRLWRQRRAARSEPAVTDEQALASSRAATVVHRGRLATILRRLRNGGIDAEGYSSEDS